MQSEFVPDINVDNFDTNHVNNQEWKDAEAVKEQEVQLRRDSVQQLFKGYYFNKNDVQKQPDNAHNQSSQILLSGAHTTTKTTSGNAMENEPVLLKGRGKAGLD